MRSFLVRVSVVVMFLCAAGMFLYERHSDANYNETLTRTRLQKWADIISRVAANNLDDPGHYNSLGEVMSAWREKGFVEAWIPPIDLERDAWGTPFSWNVSSVGKTIRIRITSAGANGVYEGGEGDDIVLEATISQNGRVANRIIH
jgi:hypothetical protein